MMAQAFGTSVWTWCLGLYPNLPHIRLIVGRELQRRVPHQHGIILQKDGAASGRSKEERRETSSLRLALPSKNTLAQALFLLLKITVFKYGCRLPGEMG